MNTLLQPVISYSVEWEEGGSALHCFTKSESFTARTSANLCFREKRKQWVYVRLYRVETVKEKLRSTK